MALAYLGFLPRYKEGFYEVNGIDLGVFWGKTGPRAVLYIRRRFWERKIGFLSDFKGESFLV